MMKSSEVTAAGMGDAQITMTALEIASIGQFAATLFSLNFLDEEHSIKGARLMHVLSEEVYNESGITENLVIPEFLRRIEEKKLPDRTITIPVVDLIALAGKLTEYRGSFEFLGGATQSAFNKLLLESRKQIKLLRERQATDAGGFAFFHQPTR